MKIDIFPLLGEQLLRARREKKFTQPDLALRLGRAPARVSELETDLKNNRLGRDRLTLFAESCDALDLVPVLMPREDASAYLTRTSRKHVPTPSQRTTFDELYIDLSSDGDD